jgi:hypothetical protein
LQNFAGPLSRTAGRYAEHDRSTPIRGDVADHVLRAVPVPAGEYTVELRYESSPLRIGLAISLISCLALIALAVAGTQRDGRVRTTPDVRDSGGTYGMTLIIWSSTTSPTTAASVPRPSKARTSAGARSSGKATSSPPLVCGS